MPHHPHAPLQKIGVIGAGVMGSGIAHWLAAQQFSVVLCDLRPDLVENGRRAICGLFEKAVARGKSSVAAAEAGLARIDFTTSRADVAPCDAVIEAIIEDLAAKQKLFAEVGRIVRPDALLASNSSALPIEEIAAKAPHPGRTLGLHFFNPVSRMSLVELIVGRHTSAGTVERAAAWMKELGKSAVICRSSPGFLVTRVLFFYLNEAVRLWESGVPLETMDRALRDFGWPMGPLRLIDEVGIDVTQAIFAELVRYFPERFQSTQACARLLDAGCRGRKNGAGSGFYVYASGKEAPNPAVASQDRRAAPIAPSAPEITDRLMGVMREEAARCLEEGVVRTAEDVDFALQIGAGFPESKGGFMRFVKSPK